MLNATATTAISANRDSLPRARESRSTLPFPDPWVLIPALLLLTLGLLMVASASMPTADAKTGQPLYFLFRQCAYVGVGLLVASMVFQIPLARWRRASPLLLLTAIGLLVLVLVLGPLVPPLWAALEMRQDLGVRPLLGPVALGALVLLHLEVVVWMHWLPLRYLHQVVVPVAVLARPLIFLQWIFLPFNRS